MKQWVVYLLACADGTCYCGVSNNLEKRIAKHNGKLAGGAKYTAVRRPVKLLGAMACADRSSAQKMEAHIKKLPRSAKIDFFMRLPSDVA